MIPIKESEDKAAMTDVKSTMCKPLMFASALVAGRYSVGFLLVAGAKYAQGATYVPRPLKNVTVFETRVNSNAS